MAQKPRQKTDNIMNYDCVVHINLPHQLGLTVSVITALCLAMWMCCGQIFTADSRNLCMYLPPEGAHRRLGGQYWDWEEESWGAQFRRLASVGGSAGSPYYCECEVFDITEWEWSTVISGDPSLAPPPEDYSGESWVKRDMNSTHYNFDLAYGGWYPYHPPEGATYLGVGVENCMADGTRSGRTVSFTTAVYCEMLRAYTVKSDDPVFLTFFRNNWMHLACGISAVATVAVSLIPWVNDVVFDLNIVPFFLYAIAIAFAFLCVLIDELYKVKYRSILRKRVARVKEETHKALLEERFEVVIEMLEKHSKMMETSNTNLRELKLHVSDIEKAVEATKAGMPSSPGKGGGMLSM
jgi:hypothetical protein